VLVNDRLVAHGEVVMVNDRYGVRFTEAIGAVERR
jgi:flagellar motor switch protein FliN/FliY